jgi:hypothetical protein
MDLRFQVQDAQFKAALRQYMEASKRDFAEVLNKKAADVCYKAAKFTKRTTKAKIAKHDPSKRPSTYPRRLFYALTNGGRSSNKSVTRGGRRVATVGSREDVAMAAYNRAQASRGYLAAAWFGVLQKMGKPVRSRISKRIIKEAEWKKATRYSLMAIVGTNNAGAGSDVAIRGLIKARDWVIRDMAKYVERKLAKTAAKFSAK